MAPYIVPEVIREILAYLDIHDLLNCRFVNGSWNEECISLLRKSTQTTQVLRSGNIDKFLKFAANSGLQPLLPFHLRIQIQSSKSKILENISQLLNHFGSECIHGLTFEKAYQKYGQPTVDRTQVYEILAKVSQGLRYLNVRWSEGAIMTKQYPDMTFPNLEELICAEGHPSGEGIGQLSEFLLAASTPKLTSLSIPLLSSNEAWPIPHNQLKALTIEKLEFDTPPTALLEAIFATHTGTTTIQLLRVKEIRERSYNHFQSFLACLAGGLRSLTIPITLFKHEHVGVPFSFPDLQNLQHLEITESDSKLIILQTLQANFLPSAFPVLTTIRIPLSLLPVQSEVRWGITNIIRTGEKFWEVKNLELDVTSGYGLAYPAGQDYKWKSATKGDADYKDITMKSILENLLEIFPSIHGLMFHVKQDSYNGAIKLVLKELLLSPLSGGIRELGLEVRGRRDCFGQVLQEIQQPPKIILEDFDPSVKDRLEKVMRNSLKDFAVGFSVGVLQPSGGNQFVFAAEAGNRSNIYMQGMEKLQYFPPRESETLSGNKYNNKAKVFQPDLSLFSKYLPAVAEVGLPFQLLGKDESSRMELLKNLRDNNPSLNLNLIYNNPQSSFRV